MIDKLRNKTAREIVTALRRDGFRLARQRGSHRTYSRGRIKITVAFHHLKDTFPIGTLSEIVRRAEWTNEDLRRLRLIK
ncbi:MAG: type II toxin-antitoxin system HicA family toxin [Candidatus Eremiobacteraeota bacterium]|nr:type II toxin-antitoxin system HicA family toxin [Candidatus Eremiobacteraeota bacterium]